MNSHRPSPSVGPQAARDARLHTPPPSHDEHPRARARARAKERARLPLRPSLDRRAKLGAATPSGARPGATTMLAPVQAKGLPAIVPHNVQPRGWPAARALGTTRRPASRVWTMPTRPSNSVLRATGTATVTSELPRWSCCWNQRGQGQGQVVMVAGKAVVTTCWPSWHHCVWRCAIATPPTCVLKRRAFSCQRRTRSCASKTTS